jgi:RNase H-fold protein (predicted Holliday junction resolvase)
MDGRLDVGVKTIGIAVAADPSLGLSVGVTMA